MKDLIFALIWFAVLGIYIFVSWKDAKSNNDVKKEITQYIDIPRRGELERFAALTAAMGLPS